MIVPMESWKENLNKYLVTEAREIESEIFFMASMSNDVSFGVFKILPYKEEYFPNVDYKVVLEPIDEHKYLKRSWYICDIESRMMPNCFEPDPKTKMFDSINEAKEYANSLNK